MNEYLYLLIPGAAIIVGLFGKAKIKVNNGKNAAKLTARELLGYSEDRFSFDDGREEAKYPPVTDVEMLKAYPECFVFGKEVGGKYVCMPDFRSVLLIGGTGSGKSSAGIVNFIALNKKQMNILYLDPKHELTDITHDELDDTVIFEPGVTSVGYDPFYNLNSDSSEQEVFEVMSTIAVSLIPHKRGNSEIWNDFARTAFSGILTYCYLQKRMRAFSEIILFILQTPLRQIVEEIVNECDVSSISYMQVVQFCDMSDEVLANVASNLTNAIRVFGVDEKLCKALGKDNDKTWNPTDLLNGNVAICLSVEQLTKLGALIYLIVNQLVLFIFGLPEYRLEPNRKRICLCLDETVAIMSAVGGSIEELSQFLRFARSKGAFALIAAQSISGLESVLTEEEVADMLSNLPYKIFFSCTESKTMTVLQKLGGSFLQKIVSYTKSIDGKRSEQHSFVTEPILTEQDILTLPSKNEVILISERQGYSRLKKVSYYTDPFIKKLINSSGRV